MSRRILAGVLLAAALAGCGKQAADHATKQLTERERDSLIGASGMPGSAVVQKALQVSDTAAAQAVRQDSVSR